MSRTRHFICRVTARLFGILLMKTPASPQKSLLVFTLFSALSLAAQPWPRHIIDASSRGADGVRLGDINGDGLPDIVTGWEEGGRIRICLNPGPAALRQTWPSVTVGTVKSPEDAVFADLDGDGRLDVVSSCEGANRTMFIHWAPHAPQDLLNAATWKTEAIPVTAGRQQWMFCLPLQIDGKNGPDLVVSSKNNDAGVSWLQSPPNPRDLQAWQLHRIVPAGWIMSLIPHDMNGDGLTDVVVSDRKGPRSGVFWLENPGPAAAIKGADWKEHRIGATGEQVMFLDLAPWSGHDQVSVLAAVKPRVISIFTKPAGDATDNWREERFDLPGPIGTAKSVRAADLDGDGSLDLVFTCEDAKKPKSGVSWFTVPRQSSSPLTWHDISGAPGVKYDLMEVLDLDGDGDLDVVTCEERDNLGVIWYENPGASGKKNP